LEASTLYGTVHAGQSVEDGRHFLQSGADDVMAMQPRDQHHRSVEPAVAGQQAEQDKAPRGQPERAICLIAASHASGDRSRTTFAVFPFIFRSSKEGSRWSIEG
jgi:hypothetical protein